MSDDDDNGPRRDLKPANGTTTAGPSRSEDSGSATPPSDEAHEDAPAASEPASPTAPAEPVASSPATEGAPPADGAPKNKRDTGPLTTNRLATRDNRMGDQPHSAHRLPRHLSERYELFEQIGRGGTGDIYRAVDHNIGKIVAIKVGRSGGHWSQSTAGHPPIENNLKHPALVGFTDRGEGNGWSWSVMPFITGVTLDRIMAVVHPEGEHRVPATVPRDDVTDEPPKAEITPEGWTIERAIAFLAKAAMAIGVAHQSGIVHLDLKPDNLMFDRDTRSPMVIDFGLAAYYREAQRAADPAGEPPPGVPAYMAPERVAGAPVDPRMDVYALGCMVYQLLVGRKPYGATEQERVRQLLLEGTPPRPISSFRSAQDEPEWVAVVEAAMAMDAGQRPADALIFGRALAQASARRRLRQLDVGLRRAGDLRKLAEQYRREAKESRSTVPPWEESAVLDEAWEKESMADELTAEASQREAIWAEDVRSLLYGHPHLADAHAALAELYGERLIRAEIAGENSLEQSVRETLNRLKRRLDDASAASAEIAPTMPPNARVRIAGIRQRIRFLLREQGHVSIVTNVPQARVYHAVFLEKGRRLTLDAPRFVGKTPLLRQLISRGSGLLIFEAPGCATVRYPIRLFRDTEWDTCPPGTTTPEPVWLPRADQVDASGCYVPAGWTWVGGDSRARDGISRRRVWVPGFVMQRNPVTNAAFIAFLTDLEEQGRADDAQRYMPRLLSAREGERGPPFFIRDTQGRLVCERAAATAPVCYVTWYAARAYADWLAARTGFPWRLPSEWEYEKAARGVDGRRLPWGNHMDVRWTCVINSREAVARAIAVDTETRDISVYGIRWLAGNIRTWCQEYWSVLGPRDGSLIDPTAVSEVASAYRISRGGSFRDAGPSVSTASRYSVKPDRYRPSIGLRLVYSIMPPKPDPTES